MNIVISYDFSVTVMNQAGGAGNIALYNNFVSATQAAVQYFNTTFSNPVTVNISFGFGEVNGSPIAPGAIGSSSTFSVLTTYTDLYNALKATDTTSAVQLAAAASLPATDPTGGAQFSVATAEASVLGLYTSTDNVGGSVGLDSSTAWSWSQAAVADGTADATGTLEHEISEVLGRSATGGAGGIYRPLDLFRYTAFDGGATDTSGTAVGVRDEAFVTGYDANAGSYFSYNGTTVTLPFETGANVATGADVADWAPTVPNDSFADSGNDGADPLSPTDLQVMNVLGFQIACFLPGTRIATPRGDVAVEQLAVGDEVLTYRGGVKALTWIGQGRALATRGRRTAATPIVVRKGALADNVPNWDLRITKGHSLYIDGVLIPAEFLVNHRSIRWDDDAREVEVFHLELDAHDILIANGAPAESYRDDGNRWLFRNANTGWDQAEKPPYAPVVTGGPIVDAIWARLLARSGPRPGVPLTEDPDLHLLVNDIRVDPLRRGDNVCTFRIDVVPHSIRIVSRSGAPDQLGLARDPRELGVALRQIIVRQGAAETSIAAEDPRLSEGFHGFEVDGGWRWTDGNAALPASVWPAAGPIREIELVVAGTTQYPYLRETPLPSVRFA